MADLMLYAPALISTVMKIDFFPASISALTCAPC